nr:MAG TPA: hypothetical protein [Caudoviricetes sp.]
MNRYPGQAVHGGLSPPLGASTEQVYNERPSRRKVPKWLLSRRM